MDRILYQLLPDIRFFPYIFKIDELPGGKMYANNGTLYGSTKMYTQYSHKALP